MNGLLLPGFLLLWVKRIKVDHKMFSNQASRVRVLNFVNWSVCDDYLRHVGT